MDITAGITALSNLVPSVAVAVIFAYLYLNLIKQNDKQEESRDKKDAAFLEALGKLTASSEANRLMVQQVADTLSKTAQVNADANGKIIEKFGEIKCVTLKKQ